MPESFRLVVDLEVDARDMQCPLPLLKAKQAINSLKTGQSVRILATDQGSVRDFKAWSEISGHEIVFFEDRDQTFTYVMKKK